METYKIGKLLHNLVLELFPSQLYCILFFCMMEIMGLLISYLLKTGPVKVTLINHPKVILFMENEIGGIM